MAESIKTKWWRPLEGEAGQICGLCFRGCRLRPGESGVCGARRGGRTELESPFLGRFAALAVDPVEKKPLRHWRPGTRILSLGSLGCPMACPFCQNQALAAPRPEAKPPLKYLPVEALPLYLEQSNLKAVAWTYNEPLLSAEYILAAAETLRDCGAVAVLVTNGQMSREALAELGPATAAANVDIKTFNPETYRRLGGSLETAKSSIAGFLNMGVHVELTALIVPGLSDDPEEFAALVEWIAGLDRRLPLHISRYFPAHKYTAPATEPELLLKFRALAAERLKNVHLGNMPPAAKRI